MVQKTAPTVASLFPSQYEHYKRERGEFFVCGEVYSSKTIYFYLLCVKRSDASNY